MKCNVAWRHQVSLVGVQSRIFSAASAADGMARTALCSGAHIGDNDLMLVMELMPGGNLGSAVHKRQVTWQRRYGVQTRL